MTVDPDAGLAVWKQVAQILRERIAAGNPPKNRRLPSIKDIADDLGVSQGSVRHALESLRQEGLIETENGRGSYPV